MSESVHLAQAKHTDVQLLWHQGPGFQSPDVVTYRGGILVEPVLFFIMLLHALHFSLPSQVSIQGCVNKVKVTAGCFSEYTCGTHQLEFAPCYLEDFPVLFSEQGKILSYFNGFDFSDFVGLLLAFSSISADQIVSKAELTSQCPVSRCVILILQPWSLVHFSPNFLMYLSIL